jgi:glycosyltransferase involved in cell wall biosynthesis
MQPGDKAVSYRALAAALEPLCDLPWQLLVAGDGPARKEIEMTIGAALPERARFLGALSLAERAPVYSACDLFVWPAVNETYGSAMYEAQAAGIPVVSSAPRGVPDSVAEGRTGVRTPPGDAEALAGAVRSLLLDSSRRAAMGRAAAAFIGEERSVDAAAARLRRALARVVPGPASPA